MHFSTLSLLSLLPLTMGLQSIYLGYWDNSAEDVYLAWFSDSDDPCEQGTIVGNHFSNEFTYCDENITILGHENITFTGCNPCSPTSLPTGVSDGGNPALTCKPASNPPGGYPCAANGGAFTFEVLEYCQ